MGFVFSRPAYILLAVLISSALFFLFLFIINIPIFLTALNFVGFSAVPQVFFNITQTIVATSGHLALYAYISVVALAGVNLSMLVFKMRVVKSQDKSPLLSFGGVFGGALAAGCPSCSISIIALLGVSGGLAALPFAGVEFSLLGAALLLVSIYFISKSIRFCEACQLHFRRK
jgi:hypothetical protein